MSEINEMFACLLKIRKAAVGVVELLNRLTVLNVVYLRLDVLLLVMVEQLDLFLQLFRLSIELLQIEFCNFVTEVRIR